MKLDKNEKDHCDDDMFCYAHNPWILNTYDIYRVKFDGYLDDPDFRTMLGRTGQNFDLALRCTDRMVSVQEGTSPMSAFPPINCKGRKLGYARVSTRDQKLRMQRDVLQEIGCDLVFEDHGISGSVDRRPGLDDLLNIVEPDDTVVVFKLDRLGRSVLHLADLLVRFQKDGIHFCSWSEGINTTTPGGKLVYHLFSAFAEFQREIIIESTVQGLEAARRRGQKLGRPPLLEADAIVYAHRAITQDGRSCSEIAKRMGVSRMTLARGFKRLELET